LKSKDVKLRDPKDGNASDLNARICLFSSTSGHNDGLNYALRWLRDAKGIKRALEGHGDPGKKNPRNQLTFQFEMKRQGANGACIYKGQSQAFAKIPLSHCPQASLGEMVRPSFVILTGFAERKAT
jgi:hypothetical protein